VAFADGLQTHGEQGVKYRNIFVQVLKSIQQQCVALAIDVWHLGFYKFTKGRYQRPDTFSGGWRK